MAPSPVPLARAAAGALFGTVARVTGRRSLHPTGVAFRGTLEVLGGLPATELFGRPGEHPAVARFSRGFGLPEPLPEILSLAIKVPDAYGLGHDQDLLLTAAGERPVLRHVFAGGRSHLERTFSSVLPFRAGPRMVIFGAKPRESALPDVDGDLDELVAAVRRTLHLDVRVAAPLGGWRRVAVLRLEGEPLDAAEEARLAFSNEHTGGGIASAGVVNAVRGAAYAASARGRGADRPLRAPADDPERVA